jgi:GMP synthase (glutamine-hydrolysing)
VNHAFGPSPSRRDGAALAGDTFDLPLGATRPAFNAHYENQAFGFGKRALALQFYLDTPSDALETWLVGHAVGLAATGVSIPRLRAGTAEMAERAGPQAQRIFSA